MAFKDEINYEKISQINKMERKSAKLVQLDPNFYSVIITHLNKLQEEYNKKYLESPTPTEALLLNNEICKLEGVIKEIYTRRERKVLLSTLDHGATTDFRNMLDHERELYKTIVKIINEDRDAVLKQKPQIACADSDYPGRSHAQSPQASNANTTSNTTTTITNTSDNAQPEGVMESQVKDQPQEQTQEPPSSQPRESPSEPDNDEDEAVLDHSNRVLVHVLDDLEPFIGTDKITYELTKEDIVTIPKDIANILLKKDKIKIVEPTI